MSSLKHKRWQVLAASISINFCLGTYYAWSIFAAGYMDLFQWPADKLTIVFIGFIRSGFYDNRWKNDG